ncbi:MAG: aminopeptidase P family protein [Deltaproteobacteria bacterium]|nr:aminopeptidase P family protein [Deltaproteobacteria bacterium]MBW2084608.1 aminopeptidase P family protein [Deltaproteobacteria bacterium]
MKKAGLSSLWIARPENRRYLSGFTAMDPQLNETSGSLLITLRNQYLLTDSRYEIQAAREAQGYTVVCSGPGPIPALARLVKKNRIAKLGFEGDHVTVTTHQELADLLKGVQTVPVNYLVERLRLIKDSHEVRKIVRALRITEAALTETLNFLQPGRTEKEAARYLEETMVDLGAEGPAFETIVASGPNAALPHAVPSGRRIKESEPVIIDCGARYKGYAADMTRTVFLGRPRLLMKRIYQVVRQAQLMALQNIKPGLTTGQADAYARDVIEAAGYGPNFGHSLGHGVGLATHEAPSLSQTRPVELLEGMVVTIEPGIYLKGRGGVRLEEMVLLKQNGCRLLNKDRTFFNF